MMLLLAKVPKKGVFTICGTIQGILFLLVGGFWLIPVALIVGGVICDFLIMGRKEITMKSMMIAYTIFSGIFAFGAIVGPMSFLQDAFVGAMEKNNIAQEYIDGMISITSGFVKGKTLVVIAHKLPAIMNADQICVMDHGKLVATGRHQELIQSCPEYQKLWKAAQDSAEWKVHTAKEGK